MNFCKSPVIVALLCFGFFKQTTHAQNQGIAPVKPLIKGARQVTVDPKTHVVSFIILDEHTNIAPQNAPVWLRSNVLGSNDPAHTFKQLRQENDALGFTHYRYQQQYNGLPIENAIYIVHCKNARMVSANGVAFKDVTLGITPKLSKQAAFQKALKYVHAEKYAWEDPKYKMQEPSLSAELLILKDKGSYKLVYKIDIYAISPLKRVYLYIDALSGNVIKEVNRIETVNATGKATTKYSGIQKITTDSINPGSFFLRESGRGGGMSTFNMFNTNDRVASKVFENSSNNWENKTDNVAYDAHFGAEVTYDFYMNNFSRNSYNKTGGPLNSYVHYSNGYVNAFWDGQEMTYGDGDGITTTALTSLDVIAHELAHGYTEYSAGLAGGSEPSALNESFSDIFGNTIRQSIKQNPVMDWLIGDEFYVNGTPGIPFRDMKHPNHFSQPDTYKGNFWDFATQEVHQNNGPQNFWYYLLVEGGNGANDFGTVYAVKGIGLKDAIQIVYRSEDVYLTPSSGYEEARTGSISAATDLFGACSNQVTQTINAWNAVGLGLKDTSALSAIFSSDVQYSCSAPATVAFSDSSIHAQSFVWSFGDGDTSMKPNPTHVYQTPGKYSVKLVVKGNPSCGGATDSITWADYINVTNNGSPKVCTCTPAVNNYCCGAGITKVIFNTIDNSSAFASEGYRDFSCSQATEVAEGSLYVLNIVTGSQNVAAWIDYNNDGTFSSSEKILDTLQTSGYVTAKVIIPGGTVLDTPLRMRIGADELSLDGCGNTESGQYEDYAVIIRANNSLPVANFNSFKACNGEVVFTTSSSLYLPNAWSWNFGDGSKSLEKSTVHTYSASGTYNVVFTICNSKGCDSITEPIEITVNPGPPLASCRPASLTNCCGIGITSFKLGTISNKTGDGSEGYKDYSCTKQTELFAGRTYNVSYSLSNQVSEDIKAWIDYNNDGNFDQTELLFNNSNTSGIKTSKVTIKKDATLLNIPLRLRVGDDFASISQIDGCAPLIYGQYEDYAVILKPDTANSGINNFNSSLKDLLLYPNPAGNLLNIVSTGEFGDLLQVSINDLLGRQLVSKSYNSVKEIAMELNIPNGVYSVVIKNMVSKEMVVKKLVVQHNQ